MTGIVVTTEACYNELAWTGAQTTFVPGFRALADADVHVYSRDANGVVTELTNPTHFTVSRDGAGAVTVTRVSFPPAPTTILIERITPAVQTVSFQDLESFPAETHTRLHTAAAMRAAENRRKIAANKLDTEAEIDALALQVTNAIGSLDAAVLAASNSAAAAAGSAGTAGTHATNANNSYNAVVALIAQSTIMYFASGEPSNAFGKDGDVYVNIGVATWPIYGPKAAGAWGVSTGDLKPVAGNVSMASNAPAADRIILSAGADKNQKASVVSVAADGTMTGARFNTPTQSYEPATKAYAEGLFATNDALLFKGVIDCSANPNYPAADAGHVYKVSVAGKIGGGSGPNVEAGDLLYCSVDSSASGNHATVGANWGILQYNVDAPLKNADIGVTVAGKSATDAALAAKADITRLAVTKVSSFTPALSEAGYVIPCDNGSTQITVTLPSNATVAFPVWTQIDFLRTNNADVVFAAGGGATVVSKGSKLKIDSLYSAATAIKISTNGWLVFGDLKT